MIGHSDIDFNIRNYTLDLLRVYYRQAIVDGLISIRELNKQLNLKLPLNWPKTLNGLILETLEDIPEANLSLKIHDVTAEILNVQGRLIKKVRLKKIILDLLFLYYNQSDEIGTGLPKQIKPQSHPFLHFLSIKLT